MTPMPREKRTLSIDGSRAAEMTPSCSQTIVIRQK
jgi:hypothetical protein